MQNYINRISYYERFIGYAFNNIRENFLLMLYTHHNSPFYLKLHFFAKMQRENFVDEKVFIIVRTISLIILSKGSIVHMNHVVWKCKWYRSVT